MPEPAISRDLMEQLMFGSGHVRRFTQDSPVLPDVWLEYAHATSLTDTTGERHIKLLLTPYRESSAGDIRRELLARVRLYDPAAQLPRVAYNQSTCAATLSFEQLVKVVIPMTGWWHHLKKTWDIDRLQQEDAQQHLAEALIDPERPPTIETADGKKRLHPDMLWLIRVVGALTLVRRREPLPQLFTGDRTKDAEGWLKLVKAVAELMRGVDAAKPLVHLVSLNRHATPTVSRSTLAIKADAARLLFKISCRDLRWAVIDSGVDARHPAFRRRERDETAKPDPFETRVVATYDFTSIDLLLDPAAKEQPPRIKKILDQDDEEASALQEQIDKLEESLNDGRTVDWKLLEPLLRIPHDEGYTPPGSDHGTHVAGILAADWRANGKEGYAEDEHLVGVCPDLELYDMRVLDDRGNGDEFTVMAALQFVRWLNSTNDYMAVHGANLSLSIPHDVANYACGRTPVCEECERVVSSGVVVVAAAGNQGYRKYAAADGRTSEAYTTISITDPGNADLVITVGATHRYRPHTYGVSYFSGRGPTGDGRLKPDLVAPGEKITAPLPDESYGLKDGTSMAAPHVSGAAALLMARHNELVGRPSRIKQILTSTATDLGRERYFQGAGMLDVLRALQSV